MQIKNELSLADSFTFKECKNLPIYRWFHYKEGYSPRAVDFCIHNASLNNPVIYDPFCGTGTTLLRAKELGFKSFGIDASPLAVLVSRVKTRNYSEQEIKNLENLNIKILENLKQTNSEMQDSFPWKFNILDPRKAFPGKTFDSFAKTRIFIESFESYQKDFFMIALLSIIPFTSYTMKDGGFLKISKSKRCISFADSWKRKIKEMLSDLKKKSIENKKFEFIPEVELADARTHIPEKKYNLVITSPPYVNAVDYSKVYGLELSLLLLSEFNLNEISGNLVSSTIFKNIKIKDEFFEKYAQLPIVANYFSDMKKCINSFSSKMESGHAFLIVSNSTVHNTNISVDEELALLFEDLGYKSEIIVGALRNTKINGRKISARESIVHAYK